MQEGKNGPLGPTVLLMLWTADTLHSVFKSKTAFHDCTSILALIWLNFLSLFLRGRMHDEECSALTSAASPAALSVSCHGPRETES